MMSDKKSERFFKVLHDRMKRAQQETKSTVAVNMSDLGSQPREDREPADPTTKGGAPGRQTQDVGDLMGGEGLLGPPPYQGLLRRPRVLLFHAQLLPLFAGPQLAPGA